MNPQYAEVARRAGHRCEYCHAPEVIFNFPFEVEHILPRASGAHETESELALACRSCNVHKAARTTGTDSLSGEIVRLFNPRRDQWSEHFQAAAGSGEILALTAIARATIQQLNMNDESQKTARQQWARLGLFP
jgi:hypothetical protein